jgi:hypothetical protein
VINIIQKESEIKIGTAKKESYKVTIDGCISKVLGLSGLRAESIIKLPNINGADHAKYHLPRSIA